MTVEQQLKAALAIFWDANAIPVTPSATSSTDAVVPMDSLSAVEALIDVDEIVGFTVVADEVIRKGGYDNREQFIDGLTAKVLVMVAARVAA